MQTQTEDLIKTVRKEIEALESRRDTDYPIAQSLARKRSLVEYLLRQA